MIKILYDNFKHWSEKGSVYIISDPHFEDADCSLIDANWPDPQEYVDNINKKITKNDTLICLGDCGKLEWFNKIKAGYKILIKGNHDDRGNSLYKKEVNPFSFEVDTPTEIIKNELGKNGYRLLYFTSLRTAFAEKGYFDEVYEGPLFIAPKILLSHEPIENLDWCVNIHGHDHSGRADVGINLAANVYNYELFNLGKEIKNGLVSKIHDIHRLTIDTAIERKEKND